MWQFIKKASARAVQISYSLSEGFSTVATVGMSMVARFGGSAYGISTSIVAGLAQIVTTFSFSGKAAYNNMLAIEDDDISLDNEISTPSKPKLATYYLTNYSYVAFYLALNWLNLYFLACNLKAYIQEDGRQSDESNDSHNHNIYVNLNALETSLLTLYYLLVDMPFILTGPVWETCKLIQKNFGVPEDKFANVVADKAKPLLTHKAFQSYVRIAGSLSHTAEHILPMAVIAVPVKWFHGLSDPEKNIVTALSIVLGTAISMPILGETYLFDGRESVAHMRSLQSDNDANIEVPVLPKKLISLLKHSIRVIGPIAHGAGAAMPIVQAGKFFKLSSAITYGVGSGVFLLSGIGNYQSEAKESVRELEELGRNSDSSERPTKTCWQWFRPRKAHQERPSARTPLINEDPPANTSGHYIGLQ